MKITAVSFYDWCIKNNRNDFLEAWDYTYNLVRPEEISKSDTNKYFFKCSKCGHNTLHRLNYLYRRKDYVLKCEHCNSFASLLVEICGNNALDKYWDYNKNKDNPWKISKSSDILVWLKCEKHKSYEIKCINFNAGRRCPYCSHQKIVHEESLGYKYPEIFEIWSNNNIVSPYEVYPKSTKKYLFNCYKHGEFECLMYNFTKNEFRCPECAREKLESILEEKVKKYIKYSYKFNLSHEYNCSIIPINPKTKHPMPFDNEIIDLKLIVEVHGRQHYELLNKNFNWLNGYSPKQYLKQRKLYDRYKKAVAECNGYFYLEIPYWTEKDESYKQLIDNKIKEILNLESQQDSLLLCSNQ